MDQVGDFSDGEFEMVIAAAAYAINSLEEGSSKKQRYTVEGLEKSLAETKSKREDMIKPITISGSFKRWFTIKDTKEEGNSVGDNSMKISTTTDQMMLDDSTANHNMTEKAMDTAPSVKKMPTLTDKYLHDTGAQRAESGKEMRTGQGTPTTIKTTSSLPGNRTPAENLDETRKADTVADDWETAQMIKIKNRYEKMISMITQWENEKKAKAKRQMEKKEHEPEQRRASALQKYHAQISTIDKVVGDARALAEERKRNDEAKTREKAKQIRLTGKIPHACSCF